MTAALIEKSVLYGGALIIAVVFVVVFAYERSVTRPCPRCGQRVGRGVMACGSCGFDFHRV